MSDAEIEEGDGAPQSKKQKVSNQKDDNNNNKNKNQKKDNGKAENSGTDNDNDDETKGTDEADDVIKLSSEIENLFKEGQFKNFFDSIRKAHKAKKKQQEYFNDDKDRIKEIELTVTKFISPSQIKSLQTCFEEREILWVKSQSKSKKKDDNDENTNQDQVEQGTVSTNLSSQFSQIFPKNISEIYKTKFPNGYNGSFAATNDNGRDDEEKKGDKSKKKDKLKMQKEDFGLIMNGNEFEGDDAATIMRKSRDYAVVRHESWLLAGSEHVAVSCTFMTSWWPLFESGKGAQILLSDHIIKLGKAIKSIKPMVSGQSVPNCQLFLQNLPLAAIFSEGLTEFIDEYNKKPAGTKQKLKKMVEDWLVIDWEQDIYHIINEIFSSSNGTNVWSWIEGKIQIMPTQTPNEGWKDGNKPAICKTINFDDWDQDPDDEKEEIEDDFDDNHNINQDNDVNDIEMDQNDNDNDNDKEEQDTALLGDGTKSSKLKPNVKKELNAKEKEKEIEQQKQMEKDQMKATFKKMTFGEKSKEQVNQSAQGMFICTLREQICSYSFFFIYVLFQFIFLLNNIFRSHKYNANTHKLI